MDRGAWQATVHGVTKSQTQLSNYALKEEERPVVVHKAPSTGKDTQEWGRTHPH